MRAYRRLLPAIATLVFAACGSVQDNSPDAAPSSSADAQVSNQADAASSSPDAASSAAPETTLTATPPDPSNQTDFEFQFTSDQAGSTFQCKLDNGNYSACTSPHMVSITGEGAHTFSVYASKDGQDDATPATHTWELDQTPPTLTIDSAPSTSTSTSASFAFTAEAGAQVQCRLDGGAFGACDSNSSHALTGLAVGAHSFYVRATDAANNQTTKSHSWSVEPPCNTIDIEAESLTGTGWNTAFGSVLHGGQALDTSVVNNSFSFTFQGKGLIIYYRKGPSAGKHTVAIDSGTPVPMTATDASGWSYQNPTTVATGLTNATHTATVTCTAASCQIDYFKVTCN
jgi:hypothetical protein